MSGEQVNLAGTEVRVRTAIAAMLAVLSGGGQVAVARRLGCSQSTVCRMTRGVWSTPMLSLRPHVGVMPQLCERGDRVRLLALRLAAQAAEDGLPVDPVSVARLLLAF